MKRDKDTMFKRAVKEDFERKNVKMQDSSESEEEKTAPGYDNQDRSSLAQLNKGRENKIEDNKLGGPESVKMSQRAQKRPNRRTPSSK